MKIRDLLFYAAAALVGLFGLVMVLGASMKWSEGDHSFGIVALGLGFGVLPMALAFWLVRFVSRGSKRQRREGLERQVLAMAAAAGGRLTPTQVAQGTSLTLGESKAFLDHLHLDGHCQMDLADDGVISYSFTT